MGVCNAGRSGRTARIGSGADVSQSGGSQGDRLRYRPDGFGHGGQASTLFTPLLQDDNPSIRLIAAYALTQAGVPSEPAMAVIMEGLADAESYVRRDTAVGLGNLGPVARPAVPRLVRSLGAKERSERAAVAVALWKIELQDNPNVMAWIRDKDLISMFESLAACRPVPVKTLAAGLTSHDSYVRMTAAKHSAPSDPRRKSALPALLALTAESAGSDRDELVSILNQIESGCRYTSQVARVHFHFPTRRRDSCSRLPRPALAGAGVYSGLPSAVPA